MYVLYDNIYIYIRRRDRPTIAILGWVGGGGQKNQIRLITSAILRRLSIIIDYY